LGTSTADADGEIKVFVDDDPASRDGRNSWRCRNWYDGVGYQPALAGDGNRK
jgi:hypothetical protein